MSRSAACLATLLLLALLTGRADAIGPGKGPGSGNDSGGGGQVPEFNPGAAGAALALLVGFTLIAVDHTRRERRVSSAPVHPLPDASN
jgi:hypothetical protein